MSSSKRPHSNFSDHKTNLPETNTSEERQEKQKRQKSTSTNKSKKDEPIINNDDSSRLPQAPVSPMIPMAARTPQDTQDIVVIGSDNEADPNNDVAADYNLVEVDEDYYPDVEPFDIDFDFDSASPTAPDFDAIQYAADRRTMLCESYNNYKRCIDHQTLLRAALRHADRRVHHARDQLHRNRRHLLLIYDQQFIGMFLE